MTTKWAGWVVAALALAALAAGAVYAANHSAEVRITARQLDDGRVEFALQQRVDGEWGERQLPRSRFFPANSAVGQWRNSSPLTIRATDEALSLPPLPADAEHWWSTKSNAPLGGQVDVSIGTWRDREFYSWSNEWSDGSSQSGWNLSLDCRDGKPSITLQEARDSTIGPHSKSIRYRMDGGSITQTRWRSPVTYYGPPSYTVPTTLARALSERSVIEIQVGEGEHYSLFTFDLRGMRHAEHWRDIARCFGIN